jgi:hypothetical protein
LMLRLSYIVIARMHPMLAKEFICSPKTLQLAMKLAPDFVFVQRESICLIGQRIALRRS